MLGPIRLDHLAPRAPVIVPRLLQPDTEFREQPFASVEHRPIGRAGDVLPTRVHPRVVAKCGERVAQIASPDVIEQADVHRAWFRPRVNELMKADAENDEVWL